MVEFSLTTTHVVSANGKAKKGQAGSMPIVNTMPAFASKLKLE